MLNISACLATFSVSNTNLLLRCPSNVSLPLLPIDNYTLPTLRRIRTLTIQGVNGDRGPLTSIPPNICFFTNLQMLNASFNRLTRLDAQFLASDPSCLQSLNILDISNNNFEEIPSLFLSEIPQLQEISLQNNVITSLDLALLVVVSGSVNLANNRISRVSNNANINMSAYSTVPRVSIALQNNSPIIELSDTIFEMYGSCQEVQTLNMVDASIVPILTIGLASINYGSSAINCTCDQYYLRQSVNKVFNTAVVLNQAPPNIVCTNGRLFYNDSSTNGCVTSSANFNRTQPRLCTIGSNQGNLTSINTGDGNTTLVSVNTANDSLSLSLIVSLPVGLSLLFDSNDQ